MDEAMQCEPGPWMLVTNDDGVDSPALGPLVRELSSLKEELLGLHERPEGARMLEGLGYRRFVVPDDAEYEPVREMSAAVEDAWRTGRGR